MIFLKRRRLLIWLIKAYFKKWRNTILLSFVVGLIFFALLYILYPFLSSVLPFQSNDSIGMVGVYTRDNLPQEVLANLSRGLTKIDKDGRPIPDIASSWSVKDNGKTYIFNLKRDFYFDSKTRLTSYLINYNFIDVSVDRPDEDTIIFKLKDNYAPFLVTASRPIFNKNFVGVGEYKVKSIDLNGDFVKSIELVLKKDNGKRLSYQFYPTESALKIGFLLGEVSKISGISDTTFLGRDLKSFPALKVERRVNYSSLVALFYNTQDSLISEEKLRKALSYAAPDNFLQGERGRSPYPPYLWASTTNVYQQDYERAKLFLSQTETGTKSASINLTIKTLSKYKIAAETIQKSWGKIGIKTKIEEVNSVPQTFQIFLGDFNVPKDPDQYVLWHSSQPNNIARYVNLRIDKLLEDGRTIENFNERKKIYADFQKYILDDPPATFLYFPFSYVVSRR